MFGNGYVDTYTILCPFRVTLAPSTMPEPEFSEFQFAYSVTRELCNPSFGGLVSSPPFFPTQNQEARLGYDVRLGSPLSALFIQYKRSKHLKDARARDVEWNFYGAPYFRFKIRTSNSQQSPAQHGILVDLADDHPHTYYVAPEFITWDEYHQYAQGNQVTDNAAFLICRDAPTRYDDDDHYICHRPQDDVARMFSEEEQPPEVALRRGIDEVLGHVLDTGPDFTSESEIRAHFRSLREDIATHLGVSREQLQEYHEAPELWVEQQQRFFHETLGVSLHFVAHDHIHRR